MSFKDNIWGAYLAYMQLISKFIKVVRFLLCVIDIYRKYAWDVSLKDKKSITITNTILKILYEINEIVVTNKDTKVYSTHQDKFINSISKNVYLNRLADIVNEYSHA